LFRRVRCPRCKVSHAVLPEDVCVYRDLTFEAVEAGLAAEGPSAGAEVSGQSGSPGVPLESKFVTQGGCSR
jgi:hypothetical protein